MRHDGREWEVVRVNLPTQGVQPGQVPGRSRRRREVAYLVDPGIGGRIREIDGRPITKLDSPKATIMALVTDGILTQKLPWGLVLIGVFLTLAHRAHGAAVAADRRGRVPADLDLVGDVRGRRGALAGGAARARRRAHRSPRSSPGPGVLFSSGLIAGGALAGVAIAGVAAALVRRADAAQVPAADYLAHVAGLQGALGAVAQNDLVALAVFACLAGALYRVAGR